MLDDKYLSPFTLILGSGSPRRAKILSNAGLSFVQRVIETDEVFPPDLPTDQIAEYIALKKAKAHKATIQTGEIILTADSIVVYENIVLGKPVDYTEAYETLKKLSGQYHEVHTGVVLYTKEHMVSFTEISGVQFSTLSHAEIDYYISQYRPYDKAGSYGIQEWIGDTKIKFIKGSYLNIMGLPMASVYEQLKSFVDYVKLSKSI